MTTPTLDRLTPLLVIYRNPAPRAVYYALERGGDGYRGGFRAGLEAAARERPDAACTVVCCPRCGSDRVIGRTQDFRDYPELDATCQRCRARFVTNGEGKALRVEQEDAIG